MNAFGQNPTYNEFADSEPILTHQAQNFFSHQIPPILFEINFLYNNCSACTL